jgi:hypothetical protein
MELVEPGTEPQYQKRQIPFVLPSAYMKGSEGVKEVTIKYKKAVFIGALGRNR